MSAPLAYAAGPKTYQVTGDLKVGSKVTVEYKMMGTAVEVKPEKGGAKKK